jgi:hypothetical protein
LFFLLYSVFSFVFDILFSFFLYIFFYLIFDSRLVAEFWSPTGGPVFPARMARRAAVRAPAGSATVALAASAMPGSTPNATAT